MRLVTTVAAFGLITIGLIRNPSAQNAAPGLVPPREALADLGEVRLWFTDTGGRGVPIVLMHAATGSSQVWEHQTPAFTAAGYRVIAYDRRGFGRSVGDAAAAPGTGADDLQGLVKFLSIEKFHLVATAAGAMVAVDYALSFPERVRSFVFANSIGTNQDGELLEIGRRIRPPQFDGLPPEFRELSPSYRATNPEGTRRWMEFERTNRPEGRRPPAQGFRNRVTLASLERLAVPTLFLTGESDFYMPPPVMRLMAARVRQAESVVLSETAHSAYWEQPEEFNRRVLAFISRH